jgi:uracil-DNA glycosylase
VVGLAPAAHGGNRTGRIFTGDRSGDWLFAALHRAGLAAQATSVHAGDGQRLIATRMLAAVRCAPPDNKPMPEERDTCAPWLLAELRSVLPTVRAVVALGAYAWEATLRAMPAVGWRYLGRGHDSRTAPSSVWRLRRVMLSSCWRRSTRVNRTPSPAG